MGRIDDQSRLRTDLDAVHQEAVYWQDVHRDRLAALPSGTTVVINVETGEYSTGDTWFAAQDAFDQLNSDPSVFGYSFTIGRPIFVGGGIWRR